MSALGQKQTYRGAGLMSALPPIATVKADIAFQGACSSRQQQRLLATPSWPRARPPLMVNQPTQPNLRKIEAPQTAIARLRSKGGGSPADFERERADRLMVELL